MWAAGLVAHELYVGYRWIDMLRGSRVSIVQLAVWSSRRHTGQQADEEREMSTLLAEIGTPRPQSMEDVPRRRPGQDHPDAEASALVFSLAFVSG